MTRDTHSMANALPSTGLHPETAFLTQQKHLTPKKKCSYHIVGRGVEHPWWTINWVAWQRDNPKWTFGQRHRRALVHLEELESVESAERTLSGYDENVEALPYRCTVCDCGERQTMSHLMTCGDAPNCRWTDLAFPTLAGVNCAKHWEEWPSNSGYRGLDEEELVPTTSS